MSTRRRVHRTAAIALALGLLVLPACGGSAGKSAAPSGSGSKGFAGEELPSKQVTLAPSTVVVSGERGRALKSVAADGTTFTLDGSASGVDQLKAGSVLLLTGVTVVKVASVQRTGGDVVIATEPAAIGDVIRDGTLSWKGVKASAGAFHAWEPKPDDASTAPAVQSGVFHPATPSPAPGGTGDVMLASVRLNAARGPAPSGSVMVGDYKLGYKITDDDNGVTHLHIDASKTGALKIEATIDGSLSSLITDGRMEVEKSVLNALEIKSNKWEGDAELNITAANGGELPPVVAEIEKLPISVDYPIVIYGIPFNLNVSAKLLFQPAFSSKTSVLKGQAKVSFGGSVGLSYEGGNVSGTGALTSKAPDPMKYVDGLGIGATAIVVAVQVPKVGFGLGWASTNVGVFFDSVLSAGITISPSTGIVACYRADINYTASVGVDAKFLGSGSINLAKKPVYTKDYTFISPNVPACTDT